MTTPAVLVCAMIIDAAFGEPDWLWKRLTHPAVLMGNLIQTLDNRFNTGGHRRVAGAVCVAFLVMLACGAGWLLSLLGPVAEVIAAAILLAQRSLVQHVAAVSEALRNSLGDARQAVAMIVSRDTNDMDESAVARSAIESAAENLSDGIIAPAFWFLIGGLPGILTYKIVNTADSMIGYRNDKYKEFGWASARLDDLLNLLPARLTAVFLAVTGGFSDLRGIRADAFLHRSPNAGWPEAALSRALGIAVAGPRFYDGELQDYPWVNAEGRRALTAVDIDKSIGMLWKAWGLSLALTVFAIFIF